MTHIEIAKASPSTKPDSAAKPPQRSSGRIPPPPGPHAASAQRQASPRTEPSSDTDLATVMITAWLDPVVDDAGHDPRSLYVERFWLGVLGPTATWLLRRLAAGLVQHPDGYVIDLAATARIMGLSYTVGRSSPFAKALQRCTMFGLAHQTSNGLAIRRRIPNVAHRHLRKMPDALQIEHGEWEDTTISGGDLIRAHTLAVAMLEAGDALEEIEHQLVAVGVTEIVAAHATDNAARLERAASPVSD